MLNNLMLSAVWICGASHVFFYNSNDNNLWSKLCKLCGWSLQAGMLKYTLKTNQSKVKLTSRDQGFNVVNVWKVLFCCLFSNCIFFLCAL